MFKLDDPFGDLDGPGHTMTSVEFLSEMALYDGSKNIRFQQRVNCKLCPCKHMSTSEVCFFDEYYSNPDFDPVVHYPFEKVGQRIIAHVRADDSVVLTVRGSTTDPNTSKKTKTAERFWAHVLSVTPDGRVTAVPKSTLHWAPVSPDNPIVFPIEAVLARVDGRYWR